ncbi:Gaa1-domain-containing protein [Flagelloscypha sp. PMI_526]|nr:Gaa1-domain-containing protein [Flagelloscypha sp. PMI_526]
MNALRDRIRQRRRLISRITSNLSVLRVLLFAAGYLWMLAIPSAELGRCTYHDENALGPGQVNTNWGWGDVHSADRRAEHLALEFNKLGLKSATQSYEFKSSYGSRSGTNAYALLSSPRTSGTEAMVISASWLSRTGEGDGTLNLRGRYSHWSKDLVLVISDGYLDGMQAWLTQYHGVSQSNLKADSLVIETSVIWTSLNIDYPGHSFSHLGVFFEGTSFNSFKYISQVTGGVPVTLYDHLDFRDHSDRPELELLSSWIPEGIRRHPEVQTYAYHARNILRHVFSYQARGRPSGVHGLFHQFRIDAITVFALPATGPHGFHAIGRVVESTMRTMNNLLERLHASFFFYILSGANGNRHRFPTFSHFLKIGSYLPSAILVSVAMMFGGLRVWTDAGWILLDNTEKKDGKQWKRRQRPVLRALSIMGTTHVLGFGLFWLLSQSPLSAASNNLVALAFASLPALLLLFSPPPSPDQAPLSSVLKALNLCAASTCHLRYYHRQFLPCGMPQHRIRRPSFPFSIFASIVYAVFSLGWLVFTPHLTSQALWDWDVINVWFAPVLCLIYYPFLIQAGLVALF